MGFAVYDNLGHNLDQSCMSAMECLMASQRCPNCQEINPAHNQFCQDCGAALGSSAIVIAQDRPIVLSKPQLPSRQLKRVGASVAVGAIALIAEVAILYLRRRNRQVDGPLLPTERKRRVPAVTEVQIEEKKVKGQRIVTVFSERVVEERRWGRPVRRIVDRLAWRSEETLES
jgi:hypothetical protein